MRLLTGAEISFILRSLTTKDASQLLSELQSGLAAYTAEHSQNNEEKIIHQPLRTVIGTRAKHTSLIMPVSDTNTTSVKVVTVPASGDIAGAITVYSPTGQLLGVMNAAEITAFRTALASMTILVDWSKQQTSETSKEMVVFGAGKQSEWHLRLALLLIPGIQSATVINRGKDRLDKFDQDVLDVLRPAYPDVSFSTIAEEGNGDYTQQLRNQLSKANIICCCTPSTKPLFAASAIQIPDGPKIRFLSLIGSYKPEMQEIDTETLQLGLPTIYVDAKEACAEEAGELIRAKDSGVLQDDNLVEAGELFGADSTVKLDGSKALTIFKCVGFGLMDLIISKALLKMAESTRKGLEVEDF